MTKPQDTPQQHAAIYSRSTSIALSAGAGCGKTYVLTKRFLSILDAGGGIEELRQIVAITFTDRAAREMRDRIREACREQLETCADEVSAKWNEIIRGLDTARISTIHSFCTRLLRSHAVDAGLDPRFGLFDRAGADMLLRREIGTLVRELLAERDPDCLEFVYQYGLERAREYLQTLVRQRFRLDFEPFLDVADDEFVSSWERNLKTVYIPRAVGLLMDSPLVERLTEFLSHNQSSHEKMEAARQSLLAELPGVTAADDPLERLQALREYATVGRTGKKAWESEDVYETVRDVLKAFREEIDKLVKDLAYDADDLAEAARLGLVAARLTVKAAARYDGAKTELGMLDFDDLLSSARDLLRTHPEVRRKAAAGIRHLMVDEFQDTDPVQAEIVRHLCGEELLTGKLFLVGDAKQSIYRFRRADPRVFHALREEIPPEGRLPLSRNFRSQPDVLHFVNCLFQQALGDQYEPLQAHHAQQSPGPTIEFLFPAGEEKANAEERRKLEAEWIARRIVAFLDGTPRIPAKGGGLRPAEPGDVVILFRSLNNVSHYEEALRRSGLDYYLVGGRAFYAQQEVYDLVNLCCYLDDPADEVALTGVLRSPMFSLSDDALYAMVQQSDSLSAALEQTPPADLDAEQQQQIAYAADVLAELRCLKDRVPIARLLERALERTGYDAVLLNEFFGRRKLANLRKLVQLARELDVSGLFTLKDFVVRLREAVSEETDEAVAATQAESSDVIRLMTIHQSKGLEFPIVFVADCDRSSAAHGKSVDVHSELGPLLPLPKRRGQSRKNPGFAMLKIDERPQDEAETKRLLYVATTRAADYLILSAGLKRKGEASSPWLRQVASCFSLDTGLPVVDPYLGKFAFGEIAPDEIPAIKVYHAPPEIPDKKRSPTERLLPLNQFVQAVEQAEERPLPETLTPFPPDLRHQAEFTATQILAADQLLHPQPHEPSSPATTSPIVAKYADVLGTAIHGVLETYDFQNNSGLAAAVDSRLPALPERERQELMQVAVTQLQGFLDSPIASEIADAQTHHRELEFLHRLDSGDPATVLIGTVDVLIETADGRWRIIDYKTGPANARKTDAQLLATYELQLAIYALAVEAVLGTLPDSAEIVVFADEPRSVRVELSPERIVGYEERIRRAVSAIRAGAGVVDRPERGHLP